jgi:hypothetical protein
MPKHHRTHIASAEAFLRESETAYRPHEPEPVNQFGLTESEFDELLKELETWDPWQADRDD